MSDCEKKIDALIDALGFDVERSHSKTYGRTVGVDQYLHGVPADNGDHWEFFPSTPMSGAYYKEIIISNDYKLTKRKGKELHLGTWMGVDIIVHTEQEAELMALIAHLGTRNEDEKI